MIDKIKSIIIKLFLVVWILIGLKPVAALAHCPLCTVGAGVLAIGANAIGVRHSVVGIFIAAFAVALGLWIHRLLNKQYIKYQEYILVALSFGLTVLPLRGLLSGYTSIYIDWMGNYGSLLNRTYLIDKFLVGSFVGAIILLIAPFLSSYITKLRLGKKISRQNLFVTFSLLLIVAILFQFIF